MSVSIHVIQVLDLIPSEPRFELTSFSFSNFYFVFRKYVDRMITLAKKGTPHHRRQAMSFLYDHDLVNSLFEAAPERYNDRQGGYCRVIKEDLPRRGDAAPMAIIELV